MLYKDITNEVQDKLPTTTNTNVAIYANNLKGNCNSHQKNKTKKNKKKKEKFNNNYNYYQKYSHKAINYQIKFLEKKLKAKELKVSLTTPTTALALSKLVMYSKAVIVLNVFKNCQLVDTRAYFYLCYNQQLFQTYTKSDILPKFDIVNRTT